MSKLFILKEWLTLPDAARHLSIVFGEDVTEADVLRLGLDRRLSLSVNFVNAAKAKCGKVVGIEEVEWGDFSAEITAAFSYISEESKGKPSRYMKSFKINSTRFLNLEKDIVTIQGVWDLPMIGGERFDIEHRYQLLTGGPKVTTDTLEGVFVMSPDGQICQLQENNHDDDNEYLFTSITEHDDLKRFLASENNIKVEEAERLLQRLREERKEFLEYMENRPELKSYCPANRLPNDSVIVVRAEALKKFENSTNAVLTSLEKPITSNERNSLLTIIAALCDYTAINPQERGTANQIAKLTEEIGAPVSDDTVRRALDKIPQALESRMK